MKKVWARWQRYLLLRRQRRQLLTMDDQARKDLALSRINTEQYAGCYGKLEKQNH